MTLKTHRNLLFALALTTLSALAVVPGTPAPDFKGTDSNGIQHSLSEYRGKFVVLEWANQGCPFDRKHYLSGSMESQQRDWTAKGVIWLSVISSAPGQQGYVTQAEENTYLKTMHAAPTAALLDPDGTIGRPTEPRPPRTSSSSIPPASSSIREPSTTSPPPIKRISKAHVTTSTKP